MSPSVSSPERQLLEAIDELMAIAASCYFQPGRPLRHLNKEERKHLYDLEGRIVGLVSIVQDGKIPLEGRPSHCPDPSRFTPATGLPCTVSPRGLSIGRSPAWEAKMLSLRAAVQAVVDCQDMNGQTDTRPDAGRKRKKRPLKNLKALLALQKAIARGERLGQTKEESAVEFTDGNVKKAQALLRSLRRNRNRSELS
jgi:hypothetical protein